MNPQPKPKPQTTVDARGHAFASTNGAVSGTPTGAPASTLGERAEGGRGPQISTSEFRLAAWIPVVDRFGQISTRTIAAAIRSSHGWHVPTGWRAVKQTLSTGEVRVSRRRSWLSAGTEAEARVLLARVAGRAA